MVVIVHRVLLVVNIVRIFLYSLINKNSLVFYSFLALWFNQALVCFKTLVVADNEFVRRKIKVPSYYFLNYIYNIGSFSFILALPDLAKKQFLFGKHFLMVRRFDLFKLFFWSTSGIRWFGLRKYFNGFSLVFGKVAEWLKAPVF
jgi:hypothetical protein